MNNSEQVSITTSSPEETFELGKNIGSACKGGEIFMLHGTLGTGKTRLMQGLGRGLGIPESVEIVSPTFVIHCQYEGKITFNHIDAYRLDGATDITELGFEEMFDDREAVTAVEWAEIIEEIIPQEKVDVSIEIAGEKERNFIFSFQKSQLEIYSQVINAIRSF